MRDVDRDELARKYPALDRDIHAVTPIVEQIEAAMRDEKPVHKATGKDGVLQEVGRRRRSPAARLHPRLSEALDAVRELKVTIPDDRWLEEVAGLNYTHSNLPDRGLLPYDEDGHDLNVYGIDHAEQAEDYRRGLDVVSRGPVGARCVVLVDSGVPAYAPKLPWVWTDDGDVAASVAAFPVAHGYSSERVAQMAMHRFASSCRWCASSSVDWGMIVSAGATTYLFPTCGSCRSDFEADFRRDRDALDFICNDGWDHATGWPADRHR